MPKGMIDDRGEKRELFHKRNYGTTTFRGGRVARGVGGSARVGTVGEGDGGVGYGSHLSIGLTALMCHVCGNGQAARGSVCVGVLGGMRGRCCEGGVMARC